MQEMSGPAGHSEREKAPLRDIEYRDASLDDAGAVSELLKEQYVEHRISAPLDEILPAVEHLIDAPERGIIFVASNGPDFVGTAVVTFTWSVEHRGKIAWLDELYIVPHWREKGIGSALLAKAMEKASEMKCRAMELEVDHEHKRAEALYLREGFERVTRDRFVLRSY